MTQFYRDLCNSEVEELARASCKMLGVDPDAQVLDNGYSDAPLIPRWWKEQEYAARFLAFWKVLSSKEPNAS